MVTLPRSRKQGVHWVNTIQFLKCGVDYRKSRDYGARYSEVTVWFCEIHEAPPMGKEALRIC